MESHHHPVTTAQDEKFKQNENPKKDEVYSQPVKIKNGHRFIPDDTLAPQGVTGGARLFPWLAKQHASGSSVSSVSEEAGQSRPSMGFTINPGDHS